MRKTYTATLCIFTIAAILSSSRVAWALDVEIRDRVTKIGTYSQLIEIQLYRSAATYHVNTNSAKSNQLLAALRASQKGQKILNLKVNADTLEIIFASSN